ncbi:hypothetical protein EDC18_10248 [Natranaerovirga pectinivora]|uniref:Uncharacterized protein n=1 Tax=Natranaerovirga pectinivora TaxID=682400 RepID=A0A4R3MSN7_9FIRM|nr:hypothetical protein [Natranaerovirga pectinivora]TCT16034.1 hypothetical protein EDC18_10248 [Natranaerovirga pectinivora]
MKKYREMILSNNRLYVTFSSFLVIFIYLLFIFGYNVFIYTSQQVKYENLFSNYLEIKEENQMLSANYETLQEVNQILNDVYENLQEQTIHLEQYIVELKLSMEEILHKNTLLMEDNYTLRKKHP